MTIIDELEPEEIQQACAFVVKINYYNLLLWL